MKKTYLAPQIQVIAANSNCILAGSVEPENRQEVGNGVQLSKPNSFGLDDLEDEE